MNKATSDSIQGLANEDFTIESASDFDLLREEKLLPSEEEIKSGQNILVSEKHFMRDGRKFYVLYVKDEKNENYVPRIAYKSLSQGWYRIIPLIDLNGAYNKS